MATSCLFLAIKVEEQDTIRLRDILNVCYRTRHPDKPPLDLSDKYWSLRNSVTQTELLIVRALGFKLDFDHPHKVTSPNVLFSVFLFVKLLNLNSFPVSISFSIGTQSKPG